MTGTAHCQRFMLSRYRTPIGVMLLVVDASDVVRAVGWDGLDARMHRLLRLHYAGTGGVSLQAAETPAALRASFDAYFEGELAALNDIAVRTGGKPFQQRVWAALRGIPPGRTWTYAQLAAKVGRPSAMRAVGAANGANPVSVIVPCHRVIGADGSLTGYASGLERKHWLLRHEGTQFRDT